MSLKVSAFKISVCVWRVQKQFNFTIDHMIPLGKVHMHNISYIFENFTSILPVNETSRYIFSFTSFNWLKPSGKGLLYYTCVVKQTM